MHSGKLRAAQIAILLSSCAAPAMAQDTAPASGAQRGGDAARSEPSLGDIVVTARRRNEALQSVPTAITAMSTVAIDQAGLRQTEDLTRVVPGLKVGGQQRGDAQFYLRGQGPASNRQGLRALPGVPAYFLEVPSPVSGPGTFYDLANVQVLKGPQGTLFGRNSTGGAILFTPVKPTADFGGYLTARLGNYDTREVQGAINVPIIGDTLLFRAAGEIARRDGFTQNVVSGQRLDDRHYDALRLSLDWKPSDLFENYLVLDGRNINQAGSSDITTEVNAALPLGSVPLGPGFSLPLTLGGAGPSVFCLQGIPLPDCPAGGAAGAVGAGIAAGGFTIYQNPGIQNALAQQQALGPRKVAFAFRQFDRERARSVTDITTITPSDSITIKNIFGFRSNRIYQASELAGLSLPILRVVNLPTDNPITSIDQYSDELQVQGKSLGGKLHWILGYYYERAVNGAPLFVASIALGPPEQFPVPAIRTTSKFRDTSNAVFAHAEYDLSDLVQGLGISAGIRQTKDNRSATLDGTDATGACVQTTCPATVRATFNGTTWDATLQYKPAPGVLTYAAIRRGFKSGGFNSPPPPGFESYGPEFVINHEIGVKAEFRIGGVPFRTNIAAFHDDYSQIQLTIPTFVNGTVVGIFKNAAGAVINGFEVEAVVSPFRGFSLTGQYSYASAKFTKDYFYAGINQNGQQLPNRSPRQYSVTARYDTALPGTLGKLGFSADYSHVSRSLVGDPLDPQPFYPGYGLVDLRAEWNNIGSSPVDLALFATNVGNKLYQMGGYPLYSQIGYRSNVYGEPRMYGAQLRVRFGADAH